MSEGKTHFERVIGGTAEEKQAALKKLQDFFEGGSTTMAEYEMEKTPEDIEIIERTGSMVNGLVKQYGGDPKPLPLDHIYVLKPGSVLAISGGKFESGIHRPLGEKIGIEKG